MCVCRLFRSRLNACHPPSPLLFSVPLVSIRPTRLWTILCPVSIVLAQPVLRAARKVMFITCTHSPHFLRCLSRCFNLYNSQLHLSLPLSFSAPRCSCLFIQRLAAVVLTENSEVGVEFQCTPAKPLGRCVFCIFTLAVPNSPHFHVGNTNIL